MIESSLNLQWPDGSTFVLIGKCEKHTIIKSEVVQLTFLSTIINIQVYKYCMCMCFQQEEGEQTLHVAQADVTVKAKHCSAAQSSSHLGSWAVFKPC